MTLPASILERIARGEDVDTRDLLPSLCADLRRDRCSVNSALAEAYTQAGQPHKAAVFAHRALLFSGFSEQQLPLYVEAQRALGNVDAVKEAYKRVGMRHLAAGNLTAAFKQFNLCHYAYQAAGHGDHYEYDFDILDRIGACARPHRFEPSRNASGTLPHKIRLAYLVYGATHSDSILLKILCDFGRLHDRERYEAVFFVPDARLTDEHIGYRETRDANIALLADTGCGVVAAQGVDPGECLFEIAREIHVFQPHMLVTTAVLADYAHYFIAALRPAQIAVGFNFGPPAQFCAPALDWIICSNQHSLIDSPCDGCVLGLEMTPIATEGSLAFARSDFGIPEDAVVILCAGRPEKFLDRDYWAAVLEILSVHADSVLVVCGLSEAPAFVRPMLTSELSPRVFLVGWRSEYLRIMAMADILIDTFPSGGGFTLLDASTLGIPVVSFRNNYMKAFDQIDWSPAEEFVPVPPLLVERGDFAAFKELVGKLVVDPEHRRALGQECREAYLRTRSSPQRMVRRLEQIYADVLSQADATRTSSDERAFCFSSEPVSIVPVQTASAIAGDACTSTAIDANVTLVDRLRRWLRLDARVRGEQP